VKTRRSCSQSLDFCSDRY